VRLRLWAGVLFVSILLLSLGGRTQLFVPFAVGFVLRHYLERRFRLAKLVFLSLAAFCAVSLFGYLRDTALVGENQTARWLHLPPAVMPLMYAYLYIRYPVATFRDITVAIPRTVGFQHGALSFGPLNTLLPGHHQQSDMYFKELLGNDFLGAGQPATLLGPLYGDAGAAGIAGGLLLFGAVLAWIYRWMRSGATAYRVLIYAWVVQTGLFSVFSNLFPYITTLWMPFLWFLLDRYMEDSSTESNSTEGIRKRRLMVMGR
jgi:oligosaccharide repeat unit polymerase